jgi:acetyl esterase/lipase
VTGKPAAEVPLIGPPVPYDPELAAALDLIVPHIPKLDSLAGIAAARASGAPGASGPTDEVFRQNGTFEVEDRVVPGAPGDPDVSLLICRPAGAAGPVPAFYHTHGGGMVMGTNRLIGDEMLGWAREFGAALISVEYRLAPETQHPGPVEDCYAGLKWTAEHADELGIDPAKIIIMGGSAGGGLAAATALLARDRGGPALAAQVLMCPMLDDRNDTPSAIQGEGRGVWDRRANETGWTALLGAARGGPHVSPYAAPARARDLSGLPPALIDVGSAETFRDEAVAYASGIWRAGGQAELHVFAGGFHGYDALAPQAAVSHDTRQARVQWLRRHLNA